MTAAPGKQRTLGIIIQLKKNQHILNNYFQSSRDIPFRIVGAAIKVGEVGCTVDTSKYPWKSLQSRYHRNDTVVI